MSREAPKYKVGAIARGAKIGIVAARFNQEIVDELLAGCLARLKELGVSEKQIHLERVPGAFELPVAARAMCRSGEYQTVVCLGAVVRGDTPHFEYVAGECARGIAEVARDEMVPVIFGVLTTNTQQQARDRIGGSHGHAGRQAAEAAVEMIGVMSRIAGKKKLRKKLK